MSNNDEQETYSIPHIRITTPGELANFSNGYVQGTYEATDGLIGCLAYLLRLHKVDDNLADTIFAAFTDFANAEFSSLLKEAKPRMENPEVDFELLRIELEAKGLPDSDSADTTD